MRRKGGPYLVPDPVDEESWLLAFPRLGIRVEVHTKYEAQEVLLEVILYHANASTLPAAEIIMLWQEIAESGLPNGPLYDDEREEVPKKRTVVVGPPDKLWFLLN